MSSPPSLAATVELVRRKVGALARKVAIVAAWLTAGTTTCAAACVCPARARRSCFRDHLVPLGDGFLQTHRLVIQIGDEPVQFIARIAKGGRKLIEGSKRGLRLLVAQAVLCQAFEFAQPDQVERSGERGVLLGLCSNDVDVFEAGGAIEAQVAQVFPEKTETFAEQENRDQSEDHDRDDRVTAEEILNRALDQTSAAVTRLFPGCGSRNRRGNLHARGCKRAGKRAKLLVLRLRDGNRQVDPYRCPAPKFTFRLDTAAVQLRDVLHDRETEPRPAELAMARFVRAVKSLEDARQIAGRNSRSAIRNTQTNQIIIARRTHPDAPFWR